MSAVCAGLAFLFAFLVLAPHAEVHVEYAAGVVSSR